MCCAYIALLHRSDAATTLANAREDTMEIRLLGPLSVSRNGTQLDVTGPKRRALLSLLAINAGSPLGNERITEALWPDTHTGREESTLRVHISHLRDVLEPDRDSDPAVLVTSGAGYMLETAHLDVDALRFVDLVSQARDRGDSEPEESLKALGEALALWRGRPLQDVEYEEFAQETIRNLESLRTVAIEERAAALIALDQDASAIEDLESLVRTDPTRERPVKLLMTSLYRSGRHADSLRVARRHTKALAVQGLDPSPDVTTLETRILQHDRDLLPEGTVPLSDITPGRSVRGYEIRAEAGSGSVGVVFRAFQPSVGREVAIKVVDPDLANRSEFVRRFTEEAKVVASLEHPHIVPLHDFWREPNGAFLVMRWMEGGTLEDRAGTPMASSEVAHIFGQLADALEYAHSAGVIHRDIRPENVLFDSSRNAYLCDFGLAVVAGGKGPGTGSPLVQPYASPEQTRGEGATTSSDIYGMGVLLTEAATGQAFPEGTDAMDPALREVAAVATSPNPADRYPDMAAFAVALRATAGSDVAAPSRHVRRNPYKGLAAFDEGDRADFYGRDDVVEALLDRIQNNGLTSVIGASGSGKSSVVMAGVLPQLRDSALPGSEDWSIVTMVPGTDPFDEFYTGLRSVAVGHPLEAARYESRELRESFAASLGGPNSKALLVVDQFEELFSADIDDATRERFLDNLVDLATDSAHRIRVVLTLRADFSDRPLAHPRFGDLMARASVLIAPMRPEQVEDVIRRPASRVGVEIEPGLVAEIVRDVSSATAYLPLLQYVLAELFEQRTSDRLTVQTYRALGGVQGVLERTAEATFTSLTAPERTACRQLFLRMVHLGDHGEETRRRLALTELHGLGARADVERALERFSEVRLLTYDRDPVTRTPTVEVAHETVIARWVRYRVWIDEARADIVTHRRISASTATWQLSEEDPTYLLVGGPLAAAKDLYESGGVSLNTLEATFVTASQDADDKTRAHEVERTREEQALASRAKRRLAIGIGTAVVAVVIGLVAAFAFVQRQRAEDLAASQERQSTARSLAAASISNLSSGDPDLSLLLAIEGADTTLESGEDVLPEVVEALHQSIISPRPALIIEGADAKLGGHVIEYSPDGTAMAVVAREGDAMVIDPKTGEVLSRFGTSPDPPFGVLFHPDGRQVTTIHPNALRQWDWRTGELLLEVTSDVNISTAVYSREGSLYAIGGSDGTITVVESGTGSAVSNYVPHGGQVNSLDFDPTGTRIVSVGNDTRAVVTDVATGDLLVEANLDTIVLPIRHVAWHPTAETAVIATFQGENLLFDTQTGERLHSYGNGQNFENAMAFDRLGQFIVAAGGDGEARIYGTQVGGEAALTLQAGGAPLRDAEMEPGSFTVATVGVDGKIRIWRDLDGSELPARFTTSLYPRLMAARDGTRLAINSNALILDLPPDFPSTMDIVDVATGETILSRPTLRGWVTLGRAAITDDGGLAAFTSPTGEIEVVDIDTEASFIIPDTAGWTNDLEFNARGDLLAGASNAGMVGVWNTSTGAEVSILEGHGDLVPTNRSSPTEQERGVSVSFSTQRADEIAWHPTDDVLASAGYDGTVRIWDTATGEGRILQAFDFEVFSVVFSPDGERLVAAIQSGEVFELDASSGEILRTLQSVSSPPELLYSPDGRFLAGAGRAGATLWDMETGRITRRFQGSVYAPSDVAFLSDGNELMVASGEGLIRSYLLDPIEMVELARTLVSRSLSDDECQQFLGEQCDP